MELTDGQLADVVVDATGSNKSMGHALTYCAFAARLVYVGITQQEVSYPKKIAFELLEAAGRRTFGFEIKSNTANPFYFVVGLQEGFDGPAAE